VGLWHLIIDHVPDEAGVRNQKASNDSIATKRGVEIRVHHCAGSAATTAGIICPAVIGRDIDAVDVDGTIEFVERRRCEQLNCEVLHRLGELGQLGVLIPLRHKDEIPPAGSRTVVHDLDSSHDSPV
jgi:hypothetical protein